jgi:short-subunit dehydrogenase
VLVNNAALGYDEPNKIPSKELAESYLNCNFLSTVKLTEELLPLLSEDGKIINVSSRVGALNNHSPVHFIVNEECSGKAKRP